MPLDAVLKRVLAEQNQRKTLRFLGIVLACVAPPFIYAYWKWGFVIASLSVLLAMLFLLSSYFIWRISHSLVFAGNWLIAVAYGLLLAIAFFTGGMKAPSLIWSAVIPMVAIVVCGPLSGLVWLVLVVAEVSLFYWFDWQGYDFIQRISNQHMGAVFYINMIGIICFSFFLAAVSEFFRSRYLQKAQETQDALRKALDNVKILKRLLPVCGSCQKIRDDEGRWDVIEMHMVRSEGKFSSLLCPECQARRSKG